MSITYLKVSKLEHCLAAVISFFLVGSENAVPLASRYLERDRCAKPRNLEGRHRSGKSFSLVPWLASAWSDTHFFPLVVKVPHCWCCLKEYDCQSKAVEDTLLTGVRKGFYGQRNAVYLFNINVCNFLGTQLCLKLILMIKLLFFR